MYMQKVRCTICRSWSTTFVAYLTNPSIPIVGFVECPHTGEQVRVDMQVKSSNPDKPVELYVCNKCHHLFIHNCGDVDDKSTG